MPRIAFIGAGSVEFTRNVLADLLSFPELEHVSITLHDINEERLATADAMARATNDRAAGGRAKIEVHLDRRAALEGADYAVNEIQVGGYDATLSDFDIPKKYGIRQTIADTLGIGGIMRGLRTIPVMVAIGNEMAELCPNGWLLNYTNPMSMVPRAVYEGTPHTRVVGLCHSVRDTHAFLAQTVGVPLEEVAFVTAGFNHQAFVLRFEHGGRDQYPRLRQVIDADPEGLGRRVRAEMFKRLGYFPTESSEHSSEYVPWFLKHDELIERYRILVDDYVFRSDENLEMYESIKRELASGADFPIQPTSELASEVIHAMETGRPHGIYGNVRNGGLIENLPPEACVEVPCFVDRAGVHPTRIGALPPQLAALNRTFFNVADLTVRGALEGDREHVYHAAMLDPNCAATLTLEQMHEMVDELISAHGDLMPEGIRAR